MSHEPTAIGPSDRPAAPPPVAGRVGHAPFIRAPDASRGIFLMVFVAACVPLGAGVVFFGWQALVVTGLSVLGCMATEALFYHVRR